MTKLKVSFFFFSLMVLVFSTDRPLAYEWTTYGHDFQRTGLSECPIDPSRLTRVWMFSHPTHGITFAGNMVTDDSLVFLPFSSFTSGVNGQLVALRHYDGSMKWSFDSLKSGTNGRASITLKDGRLYFPAGPGTSNSFRCVDAATGNQIWKSIGQGSVRFSASVIISIPPSFSCIPIYHCDNTLGPPFDCEIDGDSGRVVESLVCDTTLDSAEVIFFGTESGTLVALKTLDGSLYNGWDINPLPLGGVITNSISCSHDTLFVGTANSIGGNLGTLYAIWARDGSILWSYNTNIEGTDYGGIISAPVVTPTSIVFATWWANDPAGVFGRIHALKRDGTDLWAGPGTRGATAFYATPAIHIGTNLIAHAFTDAGIRVRDLDAGVTDYTASTHGFVRTPFAMSANGYFAFNDDEGYWYLYKVYPGIGENPKKLEYPEFATQVYGLTGFSSIATAMSCPEWAWDFPDTALFMGEVFGNVFCFNFCHCYGADIRPRTVAKLGGLPIIITIIPGDPAKTEKHTVWYNIGNGPLTYTGLTAASSPALGSALYRISKVSPQRELLANNTTDELTSISSKGFVSNKLRHVADVNLDDSYFATINKSEYIKRKQNLAEGSTAPGWLSVLDATSPPGSIGPFGDSIEVYITADPTFLAKGIYTDGFIYLEGSNDPDPQLYPCPPSIPRTECRAFQQVILWHGYPDQAGEIIAYDTLGGTVTQILVTNYGAIGDEDVWWGVNFEWNGEQPLFDGTILAGTSATDMVGDLFNTIGRGKGDQLLAGSYLNISTSYMRSGLDSFMVQEATATSFAHTGLTLDINMDAVALSQAGYNEAIFMKYDFINTGASTLKNLLTGLCLDWDVYGHSGNRDTGDVYNNLIQVSKGFYFQYVATGTQDTLFGVMPLDLVSQPRTFRGVDNGLYVYPTEGFAGPPYNELWTLMDSTGVYFPTRRYDLSSLFTFNRADLSAAETTTVIFALGGVVDTTVKLPVIDTTLGPGSILFTPIGDAVRRYRYAAGFAPRGDIDTPGPVQGIPDGKISVADLIYLIRYVYSDGPAPTPFEWLADMNGAGFGMPDGRVTPADVVFLINYLFRYGPAPTQTGAWAW